MTKDEILYENDITERSLYFERAKTSMDEFAKQEATAFFKWYGVKMMEFLQYFKRKAENPIPYSIPDAYDRFIEEFEGNTIEGLYELYEKWKITYGK